MSIDNATTSDWNKSGKWFHDSWEKQKTNGDFFNSEFAKQAAQEWYPIADELKTTPPKSLPDILKDKLRETQVGGDHYKGKIEPWDVMMDWNLDPWLANVIKYIQRHRKKAGKEDLEKAKHYLEFAIANYDAISTKYYK